MVIAIGEPAEFDVTRLGNNQGLDLIVFRFPSEDFYQNKTFHALLDRPLFRALYYKSTGNEFDDHMLSCHQGNVTVAIDEPDWGARLARKARVFLCSQLVNGGLDALFGERNYQHPASPYEGRFRRFFVRGSGLTHVLAELTGSITDYWYFLDERTQKRVREQFHVDFPENSILVTLWPQPQKIK